MDSKPTSEQGQNPSPRLGVSAVDNEVLQPLAPANSSAIARRWAILRKWLPALAFLGGFFWDAFTLGQFVQSSDLVFLGAYWLGAFVALLLLARKPSAPWQVRFTMLLQFCFGSLFSALVVCYFKSSGSLYSFLFMLLLLGVLVANEFLQDRYSRLALSWSLFALAGAMYFNFLIPHLVHGVGFLWFSISLLLSFLPLLLLRKIAQAGRASLVVPGSLVISLLLLWLLGAIPPVPLVLKQNLVCRDMERSRGEYSCLEAEQPLWVRWGLGLPRIYPQQQKTYVLSSVFAPAKVEVRLEHRWLWWNEAGGAWVQRSRIPFAMKGGRLEGWRVYSYSSRLQPGLWRVETALEGGSALGHSEFRVPEEEEPLGTTYRRVQLR